MSLETVYLCTELPIYGIVLRETSQDLNWRQVYACNYSQTPNYT